MTSRNETSEISSDKPLNSLEKSPESPLWGNIFRSLINKKDQSKIDVLSGIPIFKDLNKRELRVVTDFLYDRSYEKGEDIFLTDQPGAAMFIIKSGKVQIVVESEVDTATELAVLREGDFFGEIALLDNSPRSATARALANTELLAIFRADLDKLILNEPFIAARVMKQLAIVIGIRLKETNKQLGLLSQTDR